MRMFFHFYCLLLISGTISVALAQKAKLRREIGRECVAVSSGKAKLVTFPTRTKGNEHVPVEGVFMKPEGAGPFAAIVILHGGPGIFPPSCYVGAQEWLLEMGYASVVVDSYSAGYPGSGRTDKPTFRDRAYDGWAAAKYLASRQDIRRSSMGLIGWSLGGLATLLANSDQLDPDRDGAPAFAAAVAIAPECVSNLKNLRTHLLVLHGEADGTNPVADCQKMQVTIAKGGKFDLVTYPGADHTFDWPGSSDYDPAAAKDVDVRVRAHFGKYLFGR